MYLFKRMVLSAFMMAQRSEKYYYDRTGHPSFEGEFSLPVSAYPAMRTAKYPPVRIISDEPWNYI
jgi:hypothetical protein